MLARLVSSSASRCVASSAAISAARRWGRRSGSATGGELGHQATQRQFVAVGAKATQDRQCPVRQRGMASLRLPSENVREMDLDVWDLRGGKRIADGEARVRVRARIDQ